MNKSHLIDRLSETQSQLTCHDTALVVTSLLNTMSRHLAQGHRIEIRGFGSFFLNYRAPRAGRNPMTGQTVAVPAKYVPHFKAGKLLRELVDAA